MAHRSRLVELLQTEQSGNPAHMQHADDIVNITTIDRHTGVLAIFELEDNLLKTVLNIDTADLISWHHDVIHPHLLKIKNPQQHPPALGWQAQARLIDQGTQLLAGELIFTLLPGPNAKRVHQQRADPVHQHNHRVE